VNKTKIICTIGHASEDPAVLEQLIMAGMNVARLNLSHGDFDAHRRIIGNIRAASRATGRRVAIMADLPGPKTRIGELAQDSVELRDGDLFTLTTQDIVGDRERVSVSFPGLTKVVSQGDALYLSDGFIQLEVLGVAGPDIECRVRVGGELRSRNGLNLPGIDTGIGAFTPNDRSCLEFALAHGVDAVSQSFVTSAADVAAVRAAAAEMGHDPFIIAKIERARALDKLDDILQHADGIMVARGDLGVEIPIERIAVVQKELMTRAMIHGKPVITATHMLESMVRYRRPTRAEATDVANAILDGTDCVMLSGESAMGRYPVEATAMLARIAAATEPTRSPRDLREALRVDGGKGAVTAVDLVASSIYYALERVSPVAVLVPTRTGATARNIARYRLPVGITAFCPREAACQTLQFSYGVSAVHADEEPEDWNGYARDWLRSQGLTHGIALMTQGPSPKLGEGNHRLEILELDRGP
jgi:pyruvate kinase